MSEICFLCARKIEKPGELLRVVLPGEKKPVAVHFHHPGALEELEKKVNTDVERRILEGLYELREERKNLKFTKAGLCLACFLEGCSCRGEDVAMTDRLRKCRCCDATDIVAREPEPGGRKKKGKK